MTRSITGRAALAAGAVGIVAFAAGFDVANNDTSTGVTLLLGLLAGLLGALLGYMALHSSGRSLAAVTRAADEIAAGNLQKRVQGVSGATVELEHAFNRMASRVEELVAESVEAHARLEAVFDSAADGLIALAANTTVLYLNPAAVNMLRVDQEAALGRPFIESARDYELDELARAAAETGGQQVKAVTYGAARMPLRAVAVPITGGGDWAVLMVLNDLTEVQRVDQVRRDFLSNVSHELKTPLASVRAMLETAQDMGPTDERQEFIQRSLRQIERLGSLVDELLDLSRIESGAIELRPEPVDLAGAVAEAADSIASRLREQNIELVLPDVDTTVEADRRSLIRILTNLLDNATKYSPEGARIEVQVKDEGELVAIAVKDEGPGIAPEDLPRVFERFYKADASRANSGVGLGLAIVKHLVRAHRGTVFAECAEGGGTIFTVRLPRRFMGVASESRFLPRA